MPWEDSRDGRASPFMCWGANRIARGNVLGRDSCRSNDSMAGDSMEEHDLVERDRHGDGYAIWGKKTVL